MRYLFKMLLLTLIPWAAAQGIFAQGIDYSKYDDKFNFYVIADCGRNGYYDQKQIAETMGEMGDGVGPEFILTAGDVHHFDGIRSTSDPLWMTNFELIYSHPELMIDWYSILGNHEYRGNTQAVMDYSRISRRWNMPARYYTKSFTSEEDGATLRLVCIDTAPLIEKYRNEYEKYPDASLQSIETQLDWLESVLASAKEDWVVVVGHHPIFAQTKKTITEREDMQRRVDTILRRHHVDLYLCGHLHNFQHIRKEGSDIDYIVNTSGALSRKVSPIEGTQYCSPETGFAIATATKDKLEYRLIDKSGKELYLVTRQK